MINHVLLELFCLKKDDRDNLDCKNDIPTYDCLVKGCKFCTFTSHENAICFINNRGGADEIISLGDYLFGEKR